MIGFLQGGDKAIDAARLSLEFVRGLGSDFRGISGERVSYSLREVRLLAPISRPGKILAAGKNYAEHVLEGARQRGEEENVELQPFPRGFVKVSSVVIGP